ncbi:MAG: hypothetical protein R2750_05110 [Bacteroidales bacterium]
MQGLKIIYTILFFVLSLAVFSQDDVLYIPDKEFDSVQLGQAERLSLQDIQTKRKPGFNISFGTTFASNFGGGNYFGTYVSPHIYYPVSKRFSLRVGGTLTTTLGNTFNEPYPNRSVNYYAGNLNRSFVYAEGAYQLNDRLILTGTVYKEFNLNQSPYPDHKAISYDNKGMIFGIDYKVSKNVFIRGQLEFSNGRNPYQYSPMGFPGMGHPSDSFFYPGGFR